MDLSATSRNPNERSPHRLWLRGHRCLCMCTPSVYPGPGSLLRVACGLTRGPPRDPAIPNCGSIKPACVSPERCQAIHHATAKWTTARPCLHNPAGICTPRGVSVRHRQHRTMPGPGLCQATVQVILPSRWPMGLPASAWAHSGGARCGFGDDVIHPKFG